MQSWLAEIKVALEGHTFPLDTVTIRSASSQQTPVYPLITIEEVPTNNGVYVDAQPRIVQNVYQFEYYCQNSMIDDIITSAEDVSKLLGIDTDTFLNQTFNMTQLGDPFGNPMTNDNNVYRWVVRYTATIDTLLHDFWRNI